MFRNLTASLLIVHTIACMCEVHINILCVIVFVNAVCLTSSFKLWSYAFLYSTLIKIYTCMYSPYNASYTLKMICGTLHFHV